MDIADRRSVPLEEMQARFGDESIWVYNILRGIDHSEGKASPLLLISCSIHSHREDSDQIDASFQEYPTGSEYPCTGDALDKRVGRGTECEIEGC